KGGHGEYRPRSVRFAEQRSDRTYDWARFFKSPVRDPQEDRRVETSIEPSSIESVPSSLSLQDIMAEIVVYLRVQPTPEDKLAMDTAFDFILPSVTYVTDGVKPDVNPTFTVEYNGLVGEESGHRYVTLHYERENVVIKASFSGLGMAALASEIGNRTVREL
ncbi:hypothetical protein BGZ47_004709, partial [Haplosporangium gracile]